MAYLEPSKFRNEYATAVRPLVEWREVGTEREKQALHKAILASLTNNSQKEVSSKT